jgi:hypothetical protein
MECVGIALILVLIMIAVASDFFQRLFNKAKPVYRNRGSDVNFGFHDAHDQEILPSGYRRAEYHDLGISDSDIELWGLDQPGAPSPYAAGWVIADMLDGDFDGDIDFD